MSSSNRPYEFGSKLDSARAGFVYASTSNPFISRINLKVETTSTSSSTTRILLGLLATVLTLLIILLLSSEIFAYFQHY